MTLRGANVVTPDRGQNTNGKTYQTLPPHFHAVLLALISLITIGSHYGKHSLSSLGPEIIQLLDIQRTQYGFLFSSEEIPGIILPVVGGIALTYVPHGPAAIFLSGFILIATSLCAIAVTMKSYTALFLGRFFFGLFDGALVTLQGALVAHWFRGKISTSFGFTLLVSRTSSFLGLCLPAFLSENISLVFSMWFSVLMCVPAFLATIVFAIFAARYEVPTNEPTEAVPLVTNSTPSSEPRVEGTPRTFMNLIRSFSLPFWLICFLWLAVAGSVFSVVHFAPDAFSTHFGFSTTTSGLLSASIVIIGGLSSPAFGMLQDRIGRRALILSIACGTICVGVLVCTDAIGPNLLPFAGRSTVIVGLALIAMGVAAAPVTLMSSLALSVEDYATAAAFGLYKATENAGLAVLHVVTGALRDSRGDYVASFAVLAMLAASGAVVSIFLGRKAPFLKLSASEAAQKNRTEGSDVTLC